MPRRVFKKFAFKRKHMAEHWFLSPFRHMLHDNRLWGIRRRWVVPAFGLGLFIAFMPLPGHMFVAMLAALALRVNIPVAAVTTWVNNPATMFVIFPGAYQLGRTILGSPPKDVAFDLTWEWMTNTFVSIWQPMLLGSVLLGATAGIIGYVTLDIFWRLSLADYKNRKRSDRQNRASSKGDDST